MVINLKCILFTNFCDKIPVQTVQSQIRPCDKMACANSVVPNQTAAKGVVKYFVNQ